MSEDIDSRFVIFRAVPKTAALVSTRINNVFVAELALYLLLGLREIRHVEAWLCIIPSDHPKRLVSCWADHQPHECPELIPDQSELREAILTYTTRPLNLASTQAISLGVR